MCCILRVWKLNKSINSSHLFDLEAPGGPNSNEAKAPGGSAQTNQTPQDRRRTEAGLGWAGWLADWLKLSKISCIFTCLEGSGRLNVSYSTCLEAQNVEKYFICSVLGWKALGVKISRILCVWKALGG